MGDSFCIHLAKVLSFLSTQLGQRKALTASTPVPGKAVPLPTVWGAGIGLAHDSNTHSLWISSLPRSCLLCFSLVYPSSSHSVNASRLHLYYLCQHYSNYGQDNPLVDYKTQLMGHGSAQCLTRWKGRKHTTGLLLRTMAPLVTVNQIRERMGDENECDWLLEVILHSEGRRSICYRMYIRLPPL